jgi:hypothetical protein
MSEIILETAMEQPLPDHQTATTVRPKFGQLVASNDRLARAHCSATARHQTTNYRSIMP